MKKIIIEVEKGLVTDIYSNFQDVEVLVIDHDAELADPDEFLTNKEILQFKGIDKFVPVDFMSRLSKEGAIND
ncbi:hypothetical protein [Thermoanaerobacterium thermosaccharolyticum]|uniref:hypothetical protein n=1 Tax=Thermoanaerobacterium thermosaccharolyticum TaxID=1517 RepID=UPI00177C577C|nr:hypothetical protein [Thermoanaerobacterium thermosaccharolyticum]MBE0069940.1 hypothetical protein [Thermoanaerobacterium thermosaccharolyticum]MBE0228068.1 hypothetical protein [Thermoanaerobacterium thermosaccharolyticum]